MRRGRTAQATGVAVAIALALYTNRTQILTGIALVLLASTLIYAVFHLEWVAEAVPVFKKIVRSALGIGVVVGLVVAYGLAVWPPVHRHTLSHKEKEAFQSPLKVTKNPAVRIQLACSPSDEIDCEYAADLIPIFGEAGWDVSPEVERVTLMRPEPGITLAMRGLSQKKPEKWSDGAWLKMTPELESVYQAFSNVGIESESTTGPEIPDNQINIYVDHERDNESSPTMLSNYYVRAREARKSGSV